MTATLIPSREVQNRFGAVLDAAKREPITVTQYGRPVVTMMGVERAAEGERMLAGRRMADFLRRLPLVDTAQALSDDEINALVHELRQPS